MGRIHLLEENIANKIAAGEVVERPASVVKELVENSIDADASSITVEIKSGGISYIRVTDNGCGMDEEDSENSFVRYATSKIRNEEDLNHIGTLGFRGEALASIASVSQVEMLTKRHDDTYGIRIIIEGGENKSSESAGCADGTTIIVKNLFYNTPARLKFLKNESREAAAISELMSRLALSRPDISYKFINNGKMVFNTPGNCDLKNVLLVLYGREMLDSLIEVSHTGKTISIAGYIGNGDASRSNRNFQTFFINNRTIRNKTISAAVDNAYKSFLPVNRFAFCVLFISVHPELVDVNVHPAKAEVKFQDDRDVFSTVFNAVRNALSGERLIPDFKDNDYTDSALQQSMLKEDTGYGTIQYDAAYDFQPAQRKDMPYGGEYTFNNRISNSPIKDIDNDIFSVKGDVSRGMLPPLVIIGQCHYTYILAQGMDGLYIIDQHAAHERILYEKYRHSYEESNIESQGLMIPLVVELSPEEMISVRDNYEVFIKLGFDLEIFGNNSVILRSVPILFGEPVLKKFFLEIIDSLYPNESVINNHIDKALYTMACRGAVKAGDRLGGTEMEELVNMLSRTLYPYTCPHGRPTIIKLSKEELERKFKRIQ